MGRKIIEAGPASGGCEDVRCGCGSLLARFVDGSVELKCRRCKRVWRLPVEDEPPPRASGARRAG
jgi:phage FluMu protein Com